MSKNKFDPLYSKVLSSGYDKIDFERDRKIKLLENLFSLKLDQDYIDKSSLLLYNAHKTKNYPLKRKYLKNTIYNYDKDNNLYITFPKFKSVDKNMKEKSKTIEYLSKERNKYFITDKNNLDDDNFENLQEKINQELENNYLNFKTISNDDDNENEEFNEKGKKLYKLLKTKYPYNTTENKNSQSLPKIQNNKKGDLLLIKRITDIDPILGNNIYQNKAKILTKKQKLNLFYLSELGVFNSLDKINLKRNILSKSKNKNIKKDKLLIKDLFHYDKEKWRKINHDMNYNENEAKIDEFNEKNRKKLLNMKNTIDKLQTEKNKTEVSVQETISNIDDFLQKNSSPLFFNYTSEKTIRSFKTKNKK